MESCRYCGLDFKRVLTPSNSLSGDPSGSRLDDPCSIKGRPPVTPGSPPIAACPQDKGFASLALCPAKSPSSTPAVKLLGTSLQISPSPGRTPTPLLAAPSRFINSPGQPAEESSAFDQQTWSLISAFDKASIKDSPDSPSSRGSMETAPKSGSSLPWLRHKARPSPELPWQRDRNISTPDVAMLMESSPITPVFFSQDTRGSPMSVSPSLKTRTFPESPDAAGPGRSRLGTIQPVTNSDQLLDKHTENRSWPGESVNKVIAKPKAAAQMSQATRDFLNSNVGLLAEEDWLTQLAARGASAGVSDASCTIVISKKQADKGSANPKPKLLGIADLKAARPKPAPTKGSAPGPQDDPDPHKLGARGKSTANSGPPGMPTVMELKASWAERLNSASKASTSIPSGSATSSGQRKNGGLAPAEGMCRGVNPANAGESSRLVGDKLDITASTTAGVPPGRAAGGSNAPAREKIGQFKAPQKLLHAQSCQASSVHRPACGNYHRPFKRQLDAIQFSADANRSISAEHPDGVIPAASIVKCWVTESASAFEDSYYRSFSAASAETFWKHYERLGAHARHSYEVIEQGKPSHLYFDLEYEREINMDANGNAMVDKLIHMVELAIREYWGLQLDKAHVVELDSSTAVKFSRHLIIHLPGYAFETNIAVGSFVHRLLMSPEAAELTVRKNSANETIQEFTSMVDSAVYTKNRHFRLVWSSKGGKKAILKHTHRISGKPASEEPLKPQFMGTLVTLVEPDSKLLTLEMTRMNTRGLIKEAGGWRNFSHHPDDSYATGTDPFRLQKQDAGDTELGQLFAPEEVQRWAEAGQSFIEEAAMKLAGGAHAYVRSIVQCGTSGTVAYGLLGPGSHYCENVGRFHKSNHSFYVANFPEGVFCQKCYDPDCSHYRSAWMPLPERLCPKFGPDIQ